MVSGLVAVLLAIAAWRAEGAVREMDLVIPMVAAHGPNGYSEQWQAFDNSAWTTVHVTGDGVTPAEINFRFYRMRAQLTKYRIRIHERFAESDYPTSWRLMAIADRSPNVARWIQLHSVTDGVGAFSDGTFEAEIPFSDKYEIFRLEIKEDSSRGDQVISTYISELQLIGDWRQRHFLFPGGRYPCRRALKIVYPADFFTNPVVQGAKPFKLKSCCASDEICPPEDNCRYADSYPESGPLVVGGTFDQATQVLQFGVHGNGVENARRMVLEGNPCEDSCDPLGAAGWQALATVKRGAISAEYGKNLFVVDNPGYYKAYRLNILERDDPEISVKYAFFLVCAETATLG